MLVVLFGVSGMLGSAIEKVFNAAGYTVIGYNSSSCDITDKAQVNRVFEVHKNIDLVINCAAYTKVDDAEENFEKATLINATAVEYLARISKRSNALFVHFSTDYVFDGNSYEPYKETDLTNPVNLYGKSKYDGEINCIKNCDNYYIFRVQWLYAVNGNNFVKTMQHLFKHKQELNVVNDQLGTPTFTGSLANYVLNVVQHRPEPGIYHCTDKGSGSWFDLCKEIALYEGYKGLINPVSSNEFKRPANRPLNGVLNCTKLDNTLSIDRLHWKESLALYYKLIKEENI